MHKKSVHLTMIASYGLKRNEYSGQVQNEVTLDDLFIKLYQRYEYK